MGVVFVFFKVLQTQNFPAGLENQESSAESYFMCWSWE